MSKAKSAACIRSDGKSGFKKSILFDFYSVENKEDANKIAKEKAKKVAELNKRIAGVKIAKAAALKKM
jgi:hypothetical protein